MAKRRDRPMIRGGMGVRKKLEEESFRPTYRLNGVQLGATISECLDKYGRWEGGYRLGVLVHRTSHWVQIQWDDEEELARYEQGEARYKVDRGLWRITNPRLGNPLTAAAGQSLIALAKNKSQDALTGAAENGMIAPSANAGDSTDRGDDDMAERKLSNAAAEREAAKNALKKGELKERETYTAKQVATRCGTDAKTMRKFFRSKASTVEPVGQGGRYEFDSRDLPKIKSEFDAWRGKAEKRTPPTPKRRIDPAQVAEAAKGAAAEDDDFTMEQVADAIERAQEQDEAEVFQAVKDHFGDDHEPTEEELEEMAKLMAESGDDLELDLDDLDGEDI